MSEMIVASAVIHTGAPGPAGETGPAGPQGETGPAGATTLDGLTDTNLSSPQNNDFLIRLAGIWSNQTPAQARTILDVYSTGQVDTGLSGKSDVGHIHIIDNVTGLQTALDSKQATLTGTSDVPGLDTALSGKQATLTAPGDVPGLTAALNAKQDTLTGTSDVPGLDTALSGKQATLTGTSDVPGLDTALGNKQASSSYLSQLDALGHGTALYILRMNASGDGYEWVENTGGVAYAASNSGTENVLQIPDSSQDLKDSFFSQSSGGAFIAPVGSSQGVTISPTNGAGTPTNWLFGYNSLRQPINQEAQLINVGVAWRLQTSTTQTAAYLTGGLARFDGVASVGVVGAPTASALEVRSSTVDQIRGSYDASNYFTLGVDNVGDTTLATSGTYIDIEDICRVNRLWAMDAGSAGVDFYGDGGSDQMLVIGGTRGSLRINHNTEVRLGVGNASVGNGTLRVTSGAVSFVDSTNTYTNVFTPQTSNGWLYLDAPGFLVRNAGIPSAYFTNGNCQIRYPLSVNGSHAPAAWGTMDSRSTTNPQIVASYDGSNYFTLEANSSGYALIESSGGRTYLTDSDVRMHNATFQMWNQSNYWQFQNLNANKGIQWRDSFGNNVFWIDGAGASREFKVHAPNIGLYNVTPVAQASHIDDADGTVGGNQTAINAILAALEGIGIVASS